MEKDVKKDVQHMKACLYLAQKGMGAVSPNPMVGSIIVHGGRVIGRGYHASYGGPHAEVNAVDSVKDEDKHLLTSSTLYVNLEPCAHIGKTPPCADLIVKMKIPRVVFASDDPNPLVAGKGAERLRHAGIEVVTGVGKKEADFLNRRFFTAMVNHRPYIILKWAESEDGFMSPLEKKQVWLTGEDARILTHEWRTEEDAIMVGTHTIGIDNPELTVRLVDGKNPMRVIIDKNLSLGSHYKVFHPDAPVMVYNAEEDSINENIHRIKIDFAGDVLKQILSDLYNRKVRSLIVEGGPTTIDGFIDSGLWDEVRAFTAPVVLGKGIPAPKILMPKSEERSVGNDTLTIYIA